MPGTTKRLIVAAGPTGSDLSSDGGETWTPLGKMGFHAVGFAGPIDGGWGVGDDGTIARYGAIQATTLERSSSTAIQAPRIRWPPSQPASSNKPVIISRTLFF